MTATRREQNIQDIPINIASFDGNTLENRAITDLAVLGRNVPGLYVVDQGKRSPNQIVRVARTEGQHTARGTEVTLPTNQDIASQIGTVRELVSRNISR